MEGEPSFAELISMREAQQAKIRASLYDQNENLKDQLSEQRVRGDGESQNVVVGDNLLKFFDELQLLIQKNHDADIAAFNALQDKFEAKQLTLEQRLSQLEEQHIVDERTKELLREEQMSQHLTLCADLESLRSVADSNAKRLDARDELVGSLQTSVHALNATAAALEERLVHVEGIPAVMREDIHELDSRFTTMSAAVTAERASIKAERNEIQEKQNEEFNMVISDARRSLKNLEDNAADTMDAMHQAKRRINDQISEGIQQVGQNIEDQLNRRCEEQNDVISNANQRMSLEHMNMVQKLDDDTVAMRKKVDATLEDLKQRYDGAVEQELQDVVKKFEDFEEQRKSEFPTADSDRVQLMLQELESAFTMLEGVARNSMTQTSSKSGANPQLQGRMDSIEARLDELKIGMEVQQPKITFSVPVQATAADIDALSPEEKHSKVVERHLQRELEQAALEQGSLQSRRDALSTLNRAANRRSVSGQGSGSHSPTGASSVRSPSNYNAPPDTTRTGSAAPSSSFSVASATQGGRSVSQQGPPASEPKTLTAVRIQKEQKEAALEKIQSVLKDIQQKFHELTEKEQKGAKHTPDAKKVAQLIAQQKEAVYQKERQLIDHRNLLWREISQLRETEQRMVGGQ